MSEKLKASLENGMHRMLNNLKGEWSGTSRVWFEPGKLADESPVEGTIKPVLNGMFILHEYNTSLEGKPVEGLAIYGCSLGEGKLQSAWIDSFHNGTAIMLSENKSTKMPFSVKAGYGPANEWGWRTELNQPDKNSVIITMFNITPEGNEAKAVEITYKRK